MARSGRQYFKPLKLMKTLRNPAMLLALLYFGFAMYVLWTIPQLPLRVATHFGLSGQPNNWMSKSEYLRFMGIFGFIFPFSIVGICFLVRFLPASAFNMPRRDYWLSPEHRGETFRYFLHQSLWFACMAVGFLAGLHCLLVQANHVSGGRLPLIPLLILAGTFLIGQIGWGIHLVRHFKKVV
ncbi:MAG: hypothetical protein JWQ71_4783 [Pedosphaera sp.]|nr:hypothetical protein [Pedosphaera sp.]